MDVSRDFRDFLSALNDAKVRYLVVGAYAVAFHAEPRYTKDLDVWVEPSPQNAARVWRALSDFGAPLAELAPADFEDAGSVLQIGLAPNRIDVIMGLSGVRFATAWKERTRSSYAGVSMLVISRRDLLRAKRAAGRAIDKLDIELLLRHKPSMQRKKRKRSAT